MVPYLFTHVTLAYLLHFSEYNTHLIFIDLKSEVRVILAEIRYYECYSQCSYFLFSDATVDVPVRTIGNIANSVNVVNERDGKAACKYTLSRNKVVNMRSLQ